MPTVMEAAEIERAVRRIAHEILERNDGASDVVLVGIHTRGVPLAHRVASHLSEVEGVTVPVGSLDVGLYRDDLDFRPSPKLRQTDIPGDISDQIVVLCDDVLFTGRTVRAALDALIDFGRPRAIQLAALVDRGHRQLPVRADYVGKNLPTALSERVSVHLGLDDRSG